MPRAPAPVTMLAMPTPHDRTRRVLIPVSTPPTRPAKPPRVGRYRLARVPTYTRPDPTLDRFSHLRKSYD